MECRLHDDCCFSGCVRTSCAGADPQAAGAWRLRDRAPANRGWLPRDDIACRLPAIAQALARLFAAGRRQHMPPTGKDLSFSETAPTETPNLDPRSRNDRTIPIACSVQGETDPRIQETCGLGRRNRRYTGLGQYTLWAAHKRQSVRAAIALSADAQRSECEGDVVGHRRTRNQTGRRGGSLRCLLRNVENV